ncbi:MAG: class B sortase [Roseburia sp.]|nr:class B sortase [Roseburia sp.]
MEKYKIGRHEFDSKEEWENALSDLKKIKNLVEQLDIEDPEDTLVLYQLLRNGDVTFDGELGDAFFCDISDRVAENSRQLIKQGAKRSFFANLDFSGLLNADTPVEKEGIFKLAGVVCVVLAVVCFGVYGLSVFAENRAARKLEEVQSLRDSNQPVNWFMERSDQENPRENSAEGDQSELRVQEIQQSLEILPEYKELHKKYPDLIGWVKIEGTSIDLPVMQTVDDFYLHHNIDGEEDINGTLFLDTRDDVVKPSMNLIVYGHNMRSGAMFGSLKQYLDDGFAAKHKLINFDSIYEKGSYEVLYVCLTKVGYQDEEGYKYYNFIDPQSPEEFDAYFKSIEQCAVYDSKQEVTENDKFLTLSTCNSYTEDGRLFVVARKMQ